MSAPSVSSSTHGVSAAASGRGKSSRADSALPVNLPAQDFGQWMRQAQGKAQSAPDGEKLPTNGEKLPSGRQVAARTDAGEKGKAAHGDNDRKVKSAAPDNQSDPQPVPENAAPEPVKQNTKSGAKASSEQAAAKVDPTAVPDSNQAAAAAVADPGLQSETAVVNGTTVPDSGSGAEKSRDAHPAPREIPDLPAQAAQPDVRALATQQVGGQPQAGSQSTNHGQQVADVAGQSGQGRVADANGHKGEKHTGAAVVSDQLAAAQMTADSGVAEAKAAQQSSDSATNPVQTPQPVASPAPVKPSAATADAPVVADTSKDTASSDGHAATQPQPAVMVDANAGQADTSDQAAAGNAVSGSGDGVTLLRQPQSSGPIGNGDGSGVPAGASPTAPLAQQSGQQGQQNPQQQQQQGAGQFAAQQQAHAQQVPAHATQHVDLGASAAAASHSNGSILGNDGSAANANMQNAAAGGMAAAATSTDAGTMTSALAQRLANPAWGQALGQRAIMMAQHGPRSAEIKLDPPELGALQIRIHIGHQDQVSVSFTSPHAVVRDALEQQMPRLREMFSEQGLDLGQSSVSDQSNRQGGDTSDDSRGRRGGGSYVEEGGIPVAVRDMTPVGLVDYYA